MESENNISSIVTLSGCKISGFGQFIAASNFIKFCKKENVFEEFFLYFI